MRIRRLRRGGTLSLPIGLAKISASQALKPCQRPLPDARVAHEVDVNSSGNSTGIGHGLDDQRRGVEAGVAGEEDAILLAKRASLHNVGLPATES